MSRFCVVEGTKITLNDKETVPIERVKVGQEVLSFDLNTLQKSQKYDILVKMKTNKFEGIFQEDLVKNVWKNTVDEYYLINDKLKITKDHIVLAKRGDTYYWTKVEKLLIDDYLFTELNIFERIKSIIIVKEPVKVFNLEVNRVFNYFANSYLIHNGAPCSACLDCGSLDDYVFTPYDFGSFGHHSQSTTGGTNSYIDNGNNSWLSKTGDGDALADDKLWDDTSEQNAILSTDDLATRINSEVNAQSGISISGFDSDNNFFFTRRVDLLKTDVDPPYGVRGILPFIDCTENTEDNSINTRDAEIWFKIIAIGEGVNAGKFTSGEHYALWGIGIMHKFTSKDNTASTWKTSNTLTTDHGGVSKIHENADSFLDPNSGANAASQPSIFGDCKIMIRAKGESNIYRKSKDLKAYARISVVHSGTSYSYDSLSGTLVNGHAVLGHTNQTDDRTLSSHTTPTSTSGSLTLSGTATFLEGATIGFTDLAASGTDTGFHYETRIDGMGNVLAANGYPCGMGHRNLGVHEGGGAYGFDGMPINCNWHTQSGNGSSQQNQDSGVGDVNLADANKVIDVNGYLGMKIRDNVLQFLGKKSDGLNFTGTSSNVKTLMEKELPTHYFDKDKKLQKLSSLKGSDDGPDGCWAPFVFDSTNSSLAGREVTLEIVNPQVPADVSGGGSP
jgi:hypothetical protein